MKKLFLALCALMLCVGCTQKDTAYKSKTYVSTEEKKAKENAKEMEKKKVILIDKDAYTLIIEKDVSHYDYYYFSIKMDSFYKRYNIKVYQLKKDLQYVFSIDDQTIGTLSDNLLAVKKEKSPETATYAVKFKTKHQDLTQIKNYTMKLNCDGKIITIDMKNKYYK